MGNPESSSECLLMWLQYPLSPENIRHARWGVICLMLASAIWYLSLAVVVTVWSDQVLYKVHSKFAIIPELERNWVPFLVLLGCFTLAGCLRLLGYRLTSNVAWAVGAGDALNITMLGAVVWLSACGSIIFGFSGFLALIPAIGTLMEQRLIRLAGQIFGLVVSLQSVRQLTWFLYIRMGWCLVVFLAGLVMLISHVFIDWPRPEQYGMAEGIASPTALWVHRITTVLASIFNTLALGAILTLPFITVGYWLMLIAIYNSLPRLLDPNGPRVPLLVPDKPGFNQLKNILQNPV